MALVKQVLKQAIKAAMDGISDTEIDPAEAREQLASGLADAFDAFVKSAIVSTTITGVSPSGPVTGTGVGTLS